MTVLNLRDIEGSTLPLGFTIPSSIELRSKESIGLDSVTIPENAFWYDLPDTHGNNNPVNHWKAGIVIKAS